MNRQTYFELKKELDFSVKTNSYVKSVMIDIVMLAALMFLGQSFSFLYAIFIPVFLMRSFGYMHEAVHGSLHKNAFLNSVLGIVHGAVCFLPFQQWKKIHIEHHLWAGNPEKDPTLEIVKNFSIMSERKKKELDFFWRTKIPFIAFLQQVVFWKFSVKMVLEKKIGFAGAISSVAPLVFWGSACYMSSFPSMFFVVLGILGYLALIEFINWPHHLELYEVLDKPLPRWEQAKIARTCRYPNFFEKYVALNFNFHAEHHLFPELPWHELEHLHEKLVKIEPLLKVNYNSSWLKNARARDISWVMKYKDFDQANKKAS